MYEVSVSADSTLLHVLPLSCDTSSTYKPSPSASTLLVQLTSIYSLVSEPIAVTVSISGAVPSAL